MKGNFKENIFRSNANLSFKLHISYFILLLCHVKQYLTILIQNKYSIFLIREDTFVLLLTSLSHSFFFPESPDLNPIENLWHEMKEYIRKYIKPTKEEELIQGILKFWETVTVEKCNRYIDHLKTVIPEVIKVNGQATGY